MLKIEPTTNDLVFENGTFAEVSGVEGTGQRVRQRCQTIRGEWFLDLLFGIPYLDEKFLGAKDPNMATIEALFKAEIRKSLQGEANLTALRAVLETATRKLKVAFLIVNAEGEPDQQTFLF